MLYYSSVWVFGSVKILSWSMNYLKGEKEERKEGEKERERKEGRGEKGRRKGGREKEKARWIPLVNK